MLFGNENAFGQMHLGAKLTGGFWWTPAQDGGLEASYFELDGPDRGHMFSSADEPLMARPYIDVTFLLPNGGKPVGPSAIRAKGKTFVNGQFADVSELAMAYPHPELVVGFDFLEGRLVAGNLVANGDAGHLAVLRNLSQGGSIVFGPPEKSVFTP